MSRTPSQPTLQSGLPSLVPHGRFKGKPAMPLSRPVTVIGGRSRSHLHLVSSSVSKSHAMVVNSGAGFYIRDLASRTHVFVNGQQVVEADLKDGDIIGVGPFTFRLTDPGRTVSQTPAAPPAGVLRVANRPLPVSLTGRVAVIGRRSICEIPIDEMEVSTTHAAIFEMNGKRYIRDLGSRTGTFVNGTPVHQQPLEFGDSIRVGSAEMNYVESADELDVLGTELPDVTDDLAGTAHLPAEEPRDLVFEEPAAAAAPTLPVDRIPLEPEPEPEPEHAAAPSDNGELAAEAPALAEAPAATEAPSADALDLELEPRVEATEVEPPPLEPIAEASAAPDIQLPADDLTIAPLSPAPADEPAAAEFEVEAEPEGESALGIELLPTEEPVASQAAGPAGQEAIAEPFAAASSESSFGLDFAEAAPPGEPLPAEQPVAEAPMPAAPESAGPAPQLEESRAEPPAAAAKGKKGAMWRRLFGRTQEEPEVSAPAPLSAAIASTPPAAAEPAEPIEPPELDLAALDEELSTEESPPAPEAAPAEPVSEAPEAEPVELTPELADSPDTTAQAAAEALELEPADAERLEVVEKTEPTPESALGLDEVLPGAPAGEIAKPEAATSTESMTDSFFGREVDAFEGPSLGPIVEVPSAAAEPAPTSESAAPELEDALPPEADPLIFEEQAPAPTVSEAAPPAETVELESPPAEAAPSDVAAEAIEPAPAPEAEPAEEAPPKRRGGRRAGAKGGRRATPPKRKAPAKAAVEEEQPAEWAADLAPAAPAEQPIAEVPVPEPAPAEAVEPEPETPSVVEPSATVAAAPDEETSAKAAEPLPMMDEQGRRIDVELGRFEVPERSAPSDEPIEDASIPLTEVEAAAEDALVFDEKAAAEDESASLIQATDEPAGGPDLTPDVSPAAGAAEPEEIPQASKPADLFFGLERDTASFLGGMPLQLPPLQGPFAQGRVDVSEAPQEADEAAAEVEPIEPDEPELLPEMQAGFEPPAADEMPPPKPRRPAPPPPARMGARERGQAPAGRAVATSPFDLNLEDVPTDRIEIPPFSGPGPATRGQVTTAFDGLAMPPVREADVFSQRPLEQATIPPFGGSSAAGAIRSADESADEGEEPLDLSSSEDGADTVPDDAAAEAEPAPDFQAEPLPAAPDDRRTRAAAASSRRPPAYPSESGTSRPAPKKKRWWTGKWGLFGLMLVCMGVASAGIWYAWPQFFPNHATITASIRFEKLDTLTEAQRQSVLIEQKRKLERPEVRASAREILDKKYGGIPKGLLAETGTPQQVKTAAKNYLSLTDSMRLLEKKPVIQLQHRAADGDGDRVRVQALLDALHAENKPLRDAAAEAEREFEDKSRQLMVHRDRLKLDVMPAVESARREVGDSNALAQKRELVEALQRKERELAAAWSQTTARVQSLVAGLRTAEAAVPFDPEADPASAPPAPDDDPQVVELAKIIGDVSATLAQKKQKQTTRADEARKALATALKQFEDDIEQARKSMKVDSELGRYLDAAARIQAQLKIVSGQLAQQQLSDMERLTMLKRKLADKNEARIRQAFATDSDLQSLQEHLAIKERQYNTAVAGGLKDDARALEKEVKGLKLEIESRQDLLTTADGIAPDMKELEDFINETLKRMESDRARNDRRMAEMLKELASQAPAAGSLPAEQKAFAEQLEKRQAELNKARERYALAADAAAAEADEQVKELEAELAAAQAKLDERRKQVADAARRTLTEEQQKLREAATEQQRRELERAQQADQAAADAYAANRNALSNAVDELEKLKKRSEEFERENQKAIELTRQIQTLSDEVERIRQQTQSSVIPLPPSDEDITVVAAAADRRIHYILATDLVLGLLFFGLVLAVPAHRSDAAADEDYSGEDIPFAAPAADPDEPAALAASRVEQATEQERSTRPEASPVGV